jgi:hypothetical protein
MPFCNPDSITIPEGRFRPATIKDPGVKELADSIKEVGQLQPILVTKDKVLTAGLHRVLACELLKRDVWYEDEETGHLLLNNPMLRRVAELHENIKRRDFTPIQKSNGIAEVDRLMREMFGSKIAAPGIQEGWTQQDTAEKLGYKSSSTVSDAIKIAKAAEAGNIPGLEEAKTTSEALNMIDGFLRGKKPTIHRTFLDIEKNT